MTPNQCRSARALLGWSAETLANVSGVSVSTIRNFERGASSLMTQNKEALRSTFKAHGIEFIPGGVRKVI